MYLGLTFITCSLVHNSRISNECSQTMTLIWTEVWKREAVLYIECELWFDNFKWFFGRLTLNDSFETCCDIFLCNIVSYLFFIVFSDREGMIVFSMITRYLIVWLPFVSLYVSFFLRDWEIILRNCFVVSKRGKCEWEKFSPFPR